MDLAVGSGSRAVALHALCCGARGNPCAREGDCAKYRAEVWIFQRRTNR